jgi:hypothetical protein
VRAKGQTKDFATYSEAKREGDKLVADLAKGTDAAKLTPGQASDAVAALEQLQNFYKSTGRRLSLDYINHHNTNPKPFKWTASADMILGKVQHFCNSLG